MQSASSEKESVALVCILNKHLNYERVSGTKILHNTNSVIQLKNYYKYHRELSYSVMKKIISRLCVTCFIYIKHMMHSLYGKCKLDVSQS